MAEILIKESETGELEILLQEAPTTLRHQIENFTKIIRDNSPIFNNDTATITKTGYPEILVMCHL